MFGGLVAIGRNRPFVMREGTVATGKLRAERTGDIGRGHQAPRIPKNAGRVEQLEKETGWQSMQRIQTGLLT